MFLGDRDKDTICAISTPPGVGGIHVIRVSGPLALSTTSAIASFVPKGAAESHRVYYGTLVSSVNPNVKIDEVLITYFEFGKSFTGEEVVEISCHGNPVISSWILRELIGLGLRLADRGEFTYRAFMNGRLDLVQAESVLSMIESQTEKSVRMSLQQLEGGASTQVKEIEAELTGLLAFIEADIDFSTEGLEVISSEDIKKRLREGLARIEKLLFGYKFGCKIRSGYQVALVGEPNVGKSSLLNNILKQDRSIVSAIAGTTRDLIHDQILINGILVTLTDTAGLRESQDVVETMGVERSVATIGQADLSLVILDCGNPTLQMPPLTSRDLSKVCIVLNKIDLIKSPSNLKEIQRQLLKILQEGDFFHPDLSLEAFLLDRLLTCSAFETSASDLIKDKVNDILKPYELGDQPYLSQSRHFECLVKAKSGLTRALVEVEKGIGSEFIALDLRESLFAVQEITGQRYSEAIIDRIFSDFCIGK